MAFTSILNTLKSNRGYLISSSNAYFDFDSVTVQQHASKLKLTDNPIEGGAQMTDHAVLEPKELTINGVMVGYTPPNNIISNKIKSYSLINYALPIEVKTMTAKAENIANKITSTYNAVINQTNQIAADFIPTYNPVGDISATDRVAMGYEMLLSMQRSGELLTFHTELKQYTNMMIVSITALQQKEMSCEFSIVIREVFIVNTQKAQGLKQNLGVTQPKGVESSSALTSMTGIFL